MTIAHRLTIRLRRNGLRAPTSDVSQAHAGVLINAHRVHVIGRLVARILRLLLL